VGVHQEIRNCRFRHIDKGGIVVAPIFKETDIDCAAIELHCPNADQEAVGALTERLWLPAAILEASAEQILTKPYGRNIIVVLGSKFGISLVQMLPYQSTSKHFHRTRSEVFIVRCGTLNFYRSGVVKTIGKGGIAASTTYEPHRLANESAENLEFIELFVPGDLNDKFRIKDQYCRQLGQVSYKE
jgi:mannose-6-phosphate isomerase-like protein (cupin superfamily)